MEETTNAQKFEFKAEIKQLLNILVHSLYTSRDIFLRELISNASDALDKLRFESTKGSKINDSSLPLEIYVSFNADEKTLTITDSGIGMSKEDLVNNLGTIAKSGTSDFLKMLTESKEDASNLIGRFGVGFYSIFMVAKEVKVVTKSFKEGSTGLIWVSEGLGEYTITEATEELQRGTSITLYLKEDSVEFAEQPRLENIIKKYSNFVSFPIYLEKEKINTVSALWRESKQNVTTEQYAEFYKFLSHDFDDPSDTIHVSVDAPIQFNCLLFIPKRGDEFFYMNRDNYGLDLYVRRVLIQHQNKELLPEYLSFVKGVVDSEDLPLNISRETLQESSIFRKISTAVTTQVLNFLTKKAKDDEASYNEFWHTHGKMFKVGYGDFSNKDKYLELLRFNSSFNNDSKELTSFDAYVSRMKQDQKEIFYVAGTSREAIVLDPHLEIFRKKGIEVLYLLDPIDDIILSSIRQYKEYDFKSVNQTDLASVEKLEDTVSTENKAEALSADDETQFTALVERIKTILGDKVKSVEVSKRLTDSPSCLVNPDDPYMASFMKILKQQGKDSGVTKKVFEINKEHKLIRNLLEVFKKNQEDEFISEAVDQLYESASLLEGDLSDPHTLVQRINKLLVKTSELYKDSI